MPGSGIEPRSRPSGTPFPIIAGASPRSSRLQASCQGNASPETRGGRRIRHPRDSDLRPPAWKDLCFRTRPGRGRSSSPSPSRPRTDHPDPTGSRPSGFRRSVRPDASTLHDVEQRARLTRACTPHGGGAHASRRTGGEFLSLLDLAGDPSGLLGPADLIGLALSALPDPMEQDAPVDRDGRWSKTGSNRRPHACKARALPTELLPRSGPMPAPEGAAGLAAQERRDGRGPHDEPAWTGLHGLACTTSGHRLVGLGRLELPTSRLSSARSNQLSYKPLSDDTRPATGRQGPKAPSRSRSRQVDP